MQKYVIIVAGGTGSRMQNELPKQLIPVNGKEILLHTLDRFIEYKNDIHFIISCHKDYISTVEKLIERHHYKNVIIVEGGETRFHSVKNGLDAIKNPDSVVGIHDAARPLVSKETITKAFAIAAEKGNAIPVIPLSESIRIVDGNKNTAADRTKFRIVQTPQCFQTDLLKKAFLQEYSPMFTDDASVLEQAGFEIFLTEGNAENIKITLPKDLLIAETLLKHI